MADYYTGIGSRDTPEHIPNIMHHIGAYVDELQTQFKSKRIIG